MEVAKKWAHWQVTNVNDDQQFLKAAQLPLSFYKVSELNQRLARIKEIVCSSFTGFSEKDLKDLLTAFEEKGIESVSYSSAVFQTQEFRVAKSAEVQFDLFAEMYIS